LKPWWLLTLALSLPARSAICCPCSDEAGSAGGLVRADERYAASLLATSRRALGRFDALGRYSALGSAEGEWSEELLLRAGLRVPRRLEWLTELGYSRYRLHTTSFVERQNGIGDALLRVRYSAFDEGMPHEAFPAPAVLFSALLRAPLGAAANNGAASFGSGGAQRGLGAWELGAGIELKRSLLPTLELGLVGEAAYRFQDHALGPARRLGPRVEAALGARVLPLDWFSSTLAVRLRTVGDVSLAGRSLEGTAERLWSIVLGAAVYDRGSRLRSSVTLSVDPPLGTLSKGSTAAAALGVSLAVGAL
jgi:hypothetical protein